MGRKPRKDAGPAEAAQQELEALRARYQDLYDSAPVGYGTLGEDGSILEANATAAGLLGMPPGSLASQPLWRFVLEEDRDVCRLHLKKLFETGEPVSCELRMLCGESGSFPARLDGRAATATDGTPVCRVVLSDLTEWQRLEEALKESEAHYRSLFDKMTSGVAVYKAIGDGADFRFMDLNTAVERIEGIDREAVIGRPVTEVFPGIAEFGLLEVFRRVYRTGVPERHAAALYTDRGRSGWRQNLVYKLPSGEIVAIYEDITERKHTEQALDGARSYAERLIEAMQDGFSLLDCDGVHVAVNPAFCEMTGFSKEDLLGVGPPHPYWPPEAIEDINDAFQRTVRGNLETLELTFMRKSGERFPVLVIPSWLTESDGHVTHYYATVKDITARKRAEEALRGAEALYRSLAENSPNLIVRFDRQLRQAYVNPAAAAAGFLSAEQYVGGTIPQPVIPGPAARAWEGRIRSVFETGQRLEVENIFVTPHGPSDFHTMLVPELDATGAVRSVLSIAQDVTDRRRAEEEHAKEALLAQLELEMHRRADASTADLFEYMLEASLRVTASHHAFIISLDADETSARDVVWSKETRAQCTVAPRPSEFPVLEGGLWAECVRERRPIIVNSYADAPGKRGVPPGHVPLRRFVAVPIFDGGRISAVAAVANKSTDYVAADTDDLSRLSSRMWSIVRQRRAEAALRDRMDRLERFHVLTVDREIQMIALKKEINALLRQLGEPEKYVIVEQGGTGGGETRS